MFSLKLYINGPSKQAKDLKKKYATVHRVLEKEYWVNEFYSHGISRPLKEISAFLNQVIDIKIINGFINHVGSALLMTSALFSHRNSGNIQTYGLFILMGLVGFLMFFV